MEATDIKATIRRPDGSIFEEQVFPGVVHMDSVNKAVYFWAPGFCLARTANEIGHAMPFGGFTLEIEAA